MAFLIFAAARLTLAVDPPLKLAADLVHLKNYPIHIVSDEEEDLLGYRYSHVKKVSILPRLKCVSTILREPVYDVSSVMIGNGLKMPPGSRFIFSPSAELLYIESTADDLDLAHTILSPRPSDARALFSIDILVSLTSAGKAETLLEMKSIPFISGQRMEFSSAGESHVHLIVEPVIGPNGEAIDVSTETAIQAQGKSLKSQLTKSMRRSKMEEIEVGTLGAATVTIRLQTHLEMDYFGPPALETEAKKTAAIEEIQKALQAAQAQ